jgi:hypothetical protein
MKTLLARTFAPLMLLVSGALLCTPSPAKPGAEVIQGTCITQTPVGVYLGHFSTVATPSGRVNAHCNASLVDGPGTTQTIHAQGPGDYGTGVLVCDFVINPGGHANAECHN